MRVKLKNIDCYDYCDEKEVTDQRIIRLLEDHWFSGKMCYLFRKNQLFLEPELPAEYRVFTLFRENPFVWYEYHPDVFDIMVESGWEDGIWEYAQEEALLSLMKEWRVTWLLEKTSGNTGR